jgi:hypothetical protein
VTVVAARMATTMFGLGLAKGFMGPKYFQFCQVISNAAQISVAGKQFATADVGGVAGAGVGIGIGVILQAPFIQTQIFTLGLGAGFLGEKWNDECNVIANATAMEMAQATLMSTHTPVFAGIGNVVAGSIGVVANEWSGNIQSQGGAMGFQGPNFPQFCKVVGTGTVAGFAIATGQVTIAGSPAGPPAAGAGVGVGTIS